MAKVILLDIQYDTDGVKPSSPLPERIVFNVNKSDVKEYGSMENYIDECGSAFISDTTGWLVKGFKWKLGNIKSIARF